MATNKSLKKELAQRKEQKAGASQQSNSMSPLKSMLFSEDMVGNFKRIFKEKTPLYMANIANLISSDAELQKCDPYSIIESLRVAAGLDLPIDRKLGYAYLVPKKSRNHLQQTGTSHEKAVFQLGYKGYIQLALRTGQYKVINVVEVHEGELRQWNLLTEELTLDTDKKISDAIIGYAGYFELINGFKKAVYWSKEQIERHRNKYSTTAEYWQRDFHAMAKKTVLRNMLSKWGVLSLELQKVYSEELILEEYVEGNCEGNSVGNNIENNIGNNLGNSKGNSGVESGGNNGESNRGNNRGSNKGSNNVSNKGSNRGSNNVINKGGNIGRDIGVNAKDVDNHCGTVLGENFPDDVSLKAEEVFKVIYDGQKQTYKN